MIKSEIRTNLESLLTDLPSYNGKPPIGGPITQRVTLLWPAPFCISRNSRNISYDQPVGIIPKSMCNHTSTLLFATGKAIYNVSGPTGHSLTFTGQFPSAYSSTSPIVGATLVGSLTVLERMIKPPLPDSSSPSTSAVVWSKSKWSCSVVSDSLRPHGLQPPRLLCLWIFPGKSTGVGCRFLLRVVLWHLAVFLVWGVCISLFTTNWTGTCTLVYSSPNIFIAPNDQSLPIPLIHKPMKRTIISFLS